MSEKKKKDVSDSAITWTADCQAPLFMELSREEYWSGLPSPPPGDLPYPGIESGSPALQADSLASPGNLLNPGIKPGSPALWADALLSEPPGNPILKCSQVINTNRKMVDLKPIMSITH